MSQHTPSKQSDKPQQTLSQTVTHVTTNTNQTVTHVTSHSKQTVTHNTVHTKQTTTHISTNTRPTVTHVTTKNNQSHMSQQTPTKQSLNPVSSGTEEVTTLKTVIMYRPPCDKHEPEGKLEHHEYGLIASPNGWLHCVIIHEAHIILRRISKLI